jgi:protein SOK2
MATGRQDTILMKEKVRHVVGIGPMHLTGVWIPFDRALDLANKQNITDILYPLFVHNIGSLLYDHSNISQRAEQDPTNDIAPTTGSERSGQVEFIYENPG